MTKRVSKSATSKVAGTTVSTGTAKGTKHAFSGAILGTATLTGSATVTMARSPGEHPFYPKLGEIAALWAELEHFLDQMIWYLCGDSDHSLLSCLTGAMTGHATKGKALLALAKFRSIDAKLFSDLQAIVNVMHGEADKRNRYIHDAWFIVNGSEMMQFQSFTQKRGTYGMKPIEPKDMTDFIFSLRAKVDQMQKLTARLRAAWTPSP